jgi:nucleotide-binding universal stress UspA family protein
VLGSVANKLVEKLQHVPVWIVGGTPKPEKILVAMDTSEGAMKAVAFVGEMAAGTELKITLLNVIRGFRSPDLPKEILCTPEDEKCLIEDLTQEIDTAFGKAEEKLVQAGIDKKRITTKVIQGATSRSGAICDEAKAGGYGTIVVGRRGLSRVQEFFMGRVGQKVIHLGKETAVWVVS